MSLWNLLLLLVCLFPILFSISDSNGLMVPCTTSIYLLKRTSVWKTASSSPVLLYQDFIYHLVNRIMTVGSISFFLQLLSATFLYEEDLESYKDICMYSVALLNTVAPGPFE